MKFCHRTLVSVAIMASLATSAHSVAQDSERRNAGKGFMDEPLSDGQVLQVVRVLGNGEIAYADLALDNSRNARVRELAETIRKDHELTNDDIDAVNDVSIDMEDSRLSEHLERQVAKIQDQLAALDGAAFDCAYVNKQLENHQAALDTTHNQLIPNAKDEQVKSLLAEAAQNLEAHLDMAREVKSGLAECGEL